MKKAVKIAVGVILAPIVLFLLLILLFYFPPFQNWAVKQVSAIASQKTGMEITVDHVHLAFPLDLAVDGVKVLRQNDSIPHRKDTIADIQHTIVDIQLLPLFKSQVEVDELDIRKIKFNTTDFIASARVRGTADQLRLKSHGINLKSETILINDALLNTADVDVQLSDTVPEDTTKSENQWRIALQKLAVSKTNITVHMPGDTIIFGANIGKATVQDGTFDLGQQLYEIAKTDASLAKVTYDDNSQPRLKGLDYNHIELAEVLLGLDTLRYQNPDLYLRIRNVQLKEKSGLQLSSLGGIVKMDSTSLHIPMMNASTPYSSLHIANFDMGLKTFDDVNPDQLELQANGNLGKHDIMFFMDSMPARFKSSWPDYPLSFDCDITGNLQYLNINKFTASLPSAFDAKANGYIRNALNTSDLLADIDLDVSTFNIAFATVPFLDSSLQKMVRIPNGIKIKGKLNADGSTYKADLKASQGGGWLTVKGQCNVAVMAYNAHIQAHALPLQKYLPGMGLSPFTGAVNAVGSGTDIFSRRTHLKANAKIDSFTYQDFDLSGTTANALLQNGIITADAHCVNKLLHGNISLDALMNTKNIRATVGCELEKADFYGMKLTKAPLSTSLCAHVDVASDLDEFYKVQGFVSDVVIQDSANTYRPKDLDLNIFTQKDTTWAIVNSGDFVLDFAAKGGYKILMKVTDRMNQEFKRQLDNKYIHQDSLKQVLPFAHLALHSGKDNMVARYAQRIGYEYREINADIDTSPFDGINGYAQIDSLSASGMLFDNIRLDLVSDESGFNYKGQIKNNKDNPQYCFNALFDGSLFETGSDVNVRLYDDRNDLAVKMGLRAMLEQNGIRFKLADTNAILGYRKFVANSDNYIFLADDNRLSANMKLKADDGTGLQIYSDDDNVDALQDITLGVNHLDLSTIVSVIPYMPRVQGVLNGDFHMIQTEQQLSVSSSLGVDKLIYEGCKMGDLATEFVYIPQEDGGHYVDGILMHNGHDIGTIKGTYMMAEKENRLDAQADLKRLPLNLVNGFIPDQIIGLKGYGDGVLDIHGPLNKLDIEGVVDLDSAFLVSVPYGVELSFDDRPVKIKNSKLLLENFNMYSHNKQPLVLNGNVDFSDVEDLTLNLRMTASNFLLIDSKEHRKSEAFGKAFVNFNGTVTGSLAAVKMRGTLDVLGSSDITYIMRDTPLTTDNRLDELVKFTDFTDQEEKVVEKPVVDGLYVDLGINIDQGVRCFCALNTIKSNYVDITGGGKLRFVMKGDDMRMTGRYTISSGEMKYSLPVIPLQTFNIADGSYVEFTGDVMNPTLNITALESIRTNVNDAGTNRNVQFETGVIITKTLNDMGLEFAIDAPEDMAIHSDLQTMSKEERGKIAVTMLTTGMYLASGNTENMSVNSAFNSYLQSEINSITGNALRTLDLSFGLDNSKDAAGQLHTDYSFKFAKRFWNNRVRLVVGGKVSSGTSQTQSLFDNLALEYRLDQSANTNLKVFYERQVYDYLEGYVGEYGVGLVWKRHMDKLSDVFNLFRKQTYPQILQPADTVVVRDSMNVKKGEKK